eukprot:1219471-Pleurochrysis_carterae.AAC.1
MCSARRVALFLDAAVPRADALSLCLVSCSFAAGSRSTSRGTRWRDVELVRHLGAGSCGVVYYGRCGRSAADGLGVVGDRGCALGRVV